MVSLGQISTILTIASTAAAITLIPDAWFLDKIDSLNSSDIQKTVQIAQLETFMDGHVRSHNIDASVIADELGNLRLLIEEKADESDRQRTIDKLELRIAQSQNDIIVAQSEKNRTTRIINGNGVSPASPETYASYDNAVKQIELLEARIAADGRALARIMD